jgi:hypothetical protein
MRKTGSALTSEMVGPAGSTSEGAFSRTKSGEEDDVCPTADELDELLLGDWASAEAGAMPAKRKRTATGKRAKTEYGLIVMNNPV